MKIAITTQIRENYGAHDWDGAGACPQYWKCKGGDVYVVPNLTTAQALKVKESGIPTLTALIQTRNEAFEECVIDWAILDDDAKVCDPWETPFSLFWEQGRWVARRTVNNGEYGYMRHEVASKTEEYDMLMGGERGNYRVVYTMRNGDVVNGKDVEAYLTAATAVAA
jgi:hypothetical protein